MVRGESQLLDRRTRCFRAKMKLLQENEDATTERKFVKSQVEKRRRERMNRSLERLRSMLLQEPQQPGAAKCRMEKAEILEHTVRFLQTIAKDGPASADQRPSFQDGVSSCLQRAAQFLGPDGKDMWPGLDPALAVPDSASDPSGGCRGAKGGPLPHSKAAVVQMLRRESDRRLQAGGLKRRRFVRPVQLQALTPEQNHLPARPEEGAGSKRSLAQSHPAAQALWRPWP